MNKKLHETVNRLGENCKAQLAKLSDGHHKDVLQKLFTSLLYMKGDIEKNRLGMTATIILCFIQKELEVLPGIQDSLFFRQLLNDTKELGDSISNILRDS